MDIALPAFILGYHGCDVKVSEQVLSGNEILKASTNDYDWLGNGVYFWEHNVQRAYDFAKSMSRRPHPSGQKIQKPSVIGAVINLGFCLNLLDGLYIDMVKQAYLDMKTSLEIAGEPIPENTPRNVNDRDRVVRKLDCAVIQFLHQQRKQQQDEDPKNEDVPFQTVRAAFIEGDPLYENAGFASGNHIQVCVKDPQCIIGYFRPLDETGNPLKFN
jgi:hypothetical protein